MKTLRRDAIVASLVSNADLPADLTSIVDLASEMAHAPIALVTLVGELEQVFVARRGLDIDRTPRSQSFCAHSVASGQALWVSDATTDQRFADNPLVTGAPRIRFYAGAPVEVDGEIVGSLCVIDDKPRPFDPQLQRQLNLLAQLARERLAAHHDSRLLSGLVARSPDAIVTFDADGIIVLWNDAAERLFGYSRRETLGQSLAMILPERERAFRLEAVQNIAQGKPSGFKGPTESLIGVRRDGREVPVETSYSLERASGRFYLSAIMRDSSAWRAREEALSKALADAQAAARAKSAFIANMSHELRTPLNAIVGLSSHLAGDSAALRERMGVISNAGADLKALLDDVLDLSRQDGEAFELKPEPAFVSRLITDTLVLFELEAQEKGLDFNVDLDPNCDVSALVDPVRFRQILRNLVANALKFTERGSVSIAARVVDGILDLEIADTGRGFPPELAEKIFERFFQVDEGDRRQFGGAGLGLAIVKALVERMGGRIAAQAALGSGASFSISIPLTLAQEPSAVEERQDDPIASTLQVLVVDDNAINRQVLTMMIESLGGAVQHAENGRLAVQAAKAQRFDLILMDLQMPVMDGLTAIKLIRTHEALNQGSTSHIVVVSASDGVEDRQKSLDAGAQGHLGKPLDTRRLLELLSSL